MVSYTNFKYHEPEQRISYMEAPEDPELVIPMVIVRHTFTAEIKGTTYYHSWDTYPDGPCPPIEELLPQFEAAAREAFEKKFNELS